MRSEVFVAASLPVAAQLTLMRFPPALTLQLSLIATLSGLGARGLGVPVAVGVALGVPPAPIEVVVPVAGSAKPLGAFPPPVKSNMFVIGFARSSNDWSLIRPSFQLSSMNFRIEVCSVCV